MSLLQHRAPRVARLLPSILAAILASPVHAVQNHAAGDLLCREQAHVINAFEGAASDWVVSERLDPDLRGAFHLGMETWNSESTGGFFWYEGLTEDNNLGNFICHEGANLVRAESGDGGWTTCTFFWRDATGVTMPTCTGHRLEITLCTNTSLISDSRMVRLFAHELGHVSGLAHTDRGRGERLNVNVPSIMRAESGVGWLSSHILPFDAYCADLVRGGDHYRQLRMRPFLATLSSRGFHEWRSSGVLSPVDFGHYWSSDALVGRRVSGASLSWFPLLNVWTAVAIAQPGDRQRFDRYLADWDTLTHFEDAAVTPDGFAQAWHYHRFQSTPEGVFTLSAMAEDFDVARTPSPALLRGVPRVRATVQTPRDFGGVQVAEGFISTCDPESIVRSGDRWFCPAMNEISTFSSLGRTRDTVNDIPLISWTHARSGPHGPHDLCSLPVTDPDWPASCAYTDHSILLASGQPAAITHELAFGPVFDDWNLSAATNAPIACGPLESSGEGGGGERYNCWIVYSLWDTTAWSNRVIARMFRVVPAPDGDWSWTFEVGPSFPLRRDDGDPLRTASEVGLTYVPGNGGCGVYYLFVKSMRADQPIEIYGHRTCETGPSDWVLVQRISEIPDVEPDISIRGPVIPSESGPLVPFLLVTPG